MTFEIPQPTTIPEVTCDLEKDSFHARKKKNNNAIEQSATRGEPAGQRTLIQSGIEML